MIKSKSKPTKYLYIDATTMGRNAIKLLNIVTKINFKKINFKLLDIKDENELVRIKIPRKILFERLA